MLLGGVPGVAPGRRRDLGGGVVGTHAAMIALGMGADVAVLDRSVDAHAGAVDAVRRAAQDRSSRPPTPSSVTSRAPTS